MAKLLAILTLLFIGGCNSMSNATAKPALLTEVNPGVIATLQQAIIKAKGGTLVTLADTVFTKRSELLLSHGNSKDSNGMPIMGAHNIKPEKFVLQIIGKQCVLYYPKKDMSIELKNVNCKAR
ncbi:hypothetical protein A2I98_07135 [Pseudoalteromonas agarivorans]|uniref:Lipoprotein n=1 Tax=Pseudoalteromonas agarivorans TaxID=176102 RepID=A0ABR5VZ13_9GAMM|nr:hypothetical protein [Pseudoalteromonas telluritireducens]KYL35515.1 hypothetical protein A2I98_07135 [Pseudoalteromonas telluritireducens]|tara:strand:+ start:1011 stop:1379 length:369 start_codon:yes stop_codon:yes gene_type:complete